MTSPAQVDDAMSSSSSDCSISNDLLMEMAWQELTTTGTAYSVAAWICTSCMLVTFVVGTVTQNYSQVDKLWSILPAVYAWIPAYLSFFSTTSTNSHRMTLAAIVTTIWAVRLTFNFWRRGGYAGFPRVWEGEEDYRWSVLRSGGLVAALKHPVVWQLFSLGFISIYQNVLLLLLVAPVFVAHSIEKTMIASSSNDAYCSLSSASIQLNGWDAAATLLILTFVLIETVADNQQYVFQEEKKKRIQNLLNVSKTKQQALSGEYVDGFLQSGLFSIVRKPNYAAEQAVWISYYLWSVAPMAGIARASSSSSPAFWWINWSCVGCILLVQLFVGSGWFTESITKKKYPKYAFYMERVPLYVPNPFRWLLQPSSSASRGVGDQKKKL